jgi:hypothetical protein
MQSMWDEASDSFQEFETQEGLRPQFSLPVGVRTTLTAWTEAATASPALEWSLDGKPVALGAILEVKFEELGDHTVSVGTPNQIKSLQVSATVPGGTLASVATPHPRLSWIRCVRRCSLSATSQWISPGTYRITVILNNDGNCRTTFVLFGDGTAPSGYAWNPGPTILIPLNAHSSTMLSFDVTLMDTDPDPSHFYPCSLAALSVTARRASFALPRCSQGVLSVPVGSDCPIQ